MNTFKTDGKLMWCVNNERMYFDAKLMILCEMDSVEAVPRMSNVERWVWCVHSVAFDKPMLSKFKLGPTFDTDIAFITLDTFPSWENCQVYNNVIRVPLHRVYH